MTDPIPILTERLIAFRDARDWKQFHRLKDLMLSLNLEASELLELAQWRKEDALDRDARDPDFRARLADECADVFIYLLLICERTGIDLADAAFSKIETNERRYPVARARGNSRKYNDL